MWWLLGVQSPMYLRCTCVSCTIVIYCIMMSHDRDISTMHWFLFLTDFCFSHYNDVIMGAMRPKSPASRLFTQPLIQAEIKENIKASRHWPLCGEFTGEFPHRWPVTRKMFHLMTSSCLNSSPMGASFGWLLWAHSPMYTCRWTVDVLYASSCLIE